MVEIEGLGVAGFSLRSDLIPVSENYLPSSPDEMVRCKRETITPHQGGNALDPVIGNLRLLRRGRGHAHATPY